MKVCTKCEANLDESDSILIQHEGRVAISLQIVYQSGSSPIHAEIFVRETTFGGTNGIAKGKASAQKGGKWAFQNSKRCGESKPATSENFAGAGRHGLKSFKPCDNALKSEHRRAKKEKTMTSEESIEYEDGTSEVLTPAEWMGHARFPNTCVVGHTTNSSSVDYIQKRSNLHGILFSEEEEIAVQIEPLPSVPDATVHASPVRKSKKRHSTRRRWRQKYRQAAVCVSPDTRQNILELVLDD